MIKKFISWLYYRTHKETKQPEPAYQREYGIDLSYAMRAPSSGLYMTKVPDMPKSLEGVSARDILDASMAINNSTAMYPVNGLNDLANSNKPLKDWEIKIVQDAYSKFSVKYCSPLSEALK